MDTFVQFIHAIAWPAVVGWIAWYFRSDLKAIFPRIRQLGLGGMVVDAPAAQQAQAQAHSEKPLGEDDLSASRLYFQQYVPSEVLDYAITNVRNSVPADVAKGGVEERAEFFLRAAATLSIQFGHERIYRVIFGSQIKLLKQANERTTLPLTAAHEIFAQLGPDVVELFKQVGVDFESWLNYTVHAGLLSRDGQNLTITPLGRSFLRYMVEQRLAEAKFG